MKCALSGTLFFAALCGTVRGQWVEQKIDLKRGWNSVFLWVDPADGRLDTYFESDGIRSIHAQEPSLVPDAECEPSDVGCVPNTDPAWLTWRPASDLAHFANRLTVLSGGRVYLINASRDQKISILGKPMVGSLLWRAGWNLAGAFVSATNSPTIAEYFRNSSTHKTNVAFRLDQQAGWVAIGSSTKLLPGLGYWIRTDESSSYSGPIEIDEPTLRGVDFGRHLGEHVISLKAANPGESATIAYRPSLPAPSENPTVAGDVPLLVKELKEKAGHADWTWTPLAGSRSVDFESGSMSTRIAFNRGLELAQAVIGRDGLGQAYQGLLEISDGRGFSRFIALAGQMSGNTGLWVGTVSVDKVAWVHANLMGDVDTTSPRPAASPFSFRVVIHVDDQGAAKLLSEVMLMWDGQINDYVLVTPSTPAAMLARLKPTGLQDGQSFTRRISTAAYFVDSPLAGSGTFGTPGLEFHLNVPAGHKRNPFKHAFHPDHDNDQAGESYDIDRSMAFDFATLENGVWKGTFSEAIEGLNKPDVPVNVSGTFELSNVSTIGNLN